MSNENNNPFGEVIFSYSRKQAIEDGVLIDLTQFQVTRQHWNKHVACTDSVWSLIETAHQKQGKDYDGILHDVFTMAKLQIRRDSSRTIIFNAIVGYTVPSLKMHCGPGDTEEPVITIMLPSED